MIVPAHLGMCKKNHVSLNPKFTLDTLKGNGQAGGILPQRRFLGNGGGTNTLYLDEIVHMAHAEVTEEGTLAAVAAWARVAQGELPAYIPVQFRADHPFIFLIQDTESGNIQFGPGCRSVTEGK
ncbi:MAG: hypothetical protein METHP_00519 [Methanoregula sp. SKADARSKE-2]|nr:MAG: hypothetical protein METHP_00519 [Methanoregula sp. SKADARSKE-2]